MDSETKVTNTPYWKKINILNCYVPFMGESQSVLQTLVNDSTFLLAL